MDYIHDLYLTKKFPRQNPHANPLRFLPSHKYSRFQPKHSGSRSRI